MDSESKLMDLESTHMDSIVPQTQSYQGFRDASTSPHKRLNNTSTSPQRDVEVCCEANQASIPQKTQPPLRGAATNGGIPEGRSPAATQLPPPPQDESVALPPLCQGASGFAVSASLRPLDTESPAALSRDRHEGEGGAVTTCLPVANTCTSAHTPASLEDQAKVAGDEQGDLGRDKCSGGDEAVSKLVEQICQLAIANNCRLEEAEKTEMDTFTPKQLEVVLGDFQRQLTQHSYSGSHSMRQRFRFSLALGRYWQRE